MYTTGNVIREKQMKIVNVFIRLCKKLIASHMLKYEIFLKVIIYQLAAIYQKRTPSFKEMQGVLTFYELTTRTY